MPDDENSELADPHQSKRSRGEKMMNQSGEKHAVRGVLAGVAGGLVASWVMNQFIERLSGPLQEAVQSDKENQQQKVQAAQQKESGEPKIDATMKTADALVNLATGGRHLSLEEKQKDGPIVHYAFGAAMGAVYGGLAEYSGLPKAAFGTLFGSALFVGADLFAVPALHLSGSAAEQPTSALATPFVAHLVYGTTTELFRRVFRTLL